MSSNSNDPCGRSSTWNLEIWCNLPSQNLCSELAPREVNQMLKDFDSETWIYLRFVALWWFCVFNQGSIFSIFWQFRTMSIRFLEMPKQRLTSIASQAGQQKRSKEACVRLPRLSGRGVGMCCRRPPTWPATWEVVNCLMNYTSVWTNDNWCQSHQCLGFDSGSSAAVKQACCRPGSLTTDDWHSHVKITG